MIIRIDFEILLSCKEGDKQSFTKLFKAYEKYLFNLCFKYTVNMHDALDLVQEIYIKIFKNYDKYDINRPFHPWVRKIAVNTCLNFKKEIRSNIISLNAIIQDNVTIEGLLASEESPEKEIEKYDFERIIKKQIDALSNKQKMALTLRYFDGLSYEEIANAMGQPLSTVKTCLYRARKALKKDLANMLEENI